MALPALVAPGFWRHPKLFRLAASLEQPKVMCGGSLVALWGWCHEYRPTGSLEGLSDSEIAAAAEWPLDPSRYVAALRACGWLDSLEVHDFAVRQGKKAIKNAQSATRMANKRERERNSSVTGANNSVTPFPLPLPVPCPVPIPKVPMSPPGTPFLKFWTLWPSHKRKKGRPQCEKKWATMDEATRKTIIDKLPSFVKSWDWTKEGREYMPGPVPWLNAAGWEAEAGAESVSSGPVLTAYDPEPDDDGPQLTVFGEDSNV